MPTLYDAVIETLTPIVGKPAAEICMRSSAMELGKHAELFGIGDLPTLERNIRKSLASFTTTALLDSAISEIRSKVE